MARKRKIKWAQSLTEESAIVEERSRRRVEKAAKKLKGAKVNLKDPPTGCDARCKEPGSAAYFRHRRRGEYACDDALAEWAILIRKYRKGADA